MYASVRKYSVDAKRRQRVHAPVGPEVRGAVEADARLIAYQAIDVGADRARCSR